MADCGYIVFFHNWIKFPSDKQRELILDKAKEYKIKGGIIKEFYAKKQTPIAPFKRDDKTFWDCVKWGDKHGIANLRCVEFDWLHGLGVSSYSCEYRSWMEIVAGLS